MGVKFVGVRNSPYKHWLLTRGKRSQILVDTVDLVYDCMRHSDFLEVYAQGGVDADFSSTLYWRFLLSVGHTRDSAQARCLRFGKLFDDLKTQSSESNFKGVAVTIDGIRLDGSHRASIAYFLGIPKIEVDCFSLGGVLNHIDFGGMKHEASAKRALQERHLGRRVYRKDDGRYLGSVLFVDARPKTRIIPFVQRYFWSRRLEPWMAVADENGPIQMLPLQQISVE